MLAVAGTDDTGAELCKDEGLTSRELTFEVLEDEDDDEDGITEDDLDLEELWGDTCWCCWWRSVFGDLKDVDVFCFTVTADAGDVCGANLCFTSLFPPDSFGAVVLSFEMIDLAGECTAGLDDDDTTLVWWWDEDDTDDDEIAQDSAGFEDTGFVGLEGKTGDGDEWDDGQWDNANEEGRFESPLGG